MEEKTKKDIKAEAETLLQKRWVQNALFYTAGVASGVGIMVVRASLKASEVVVTSGA